MQKVYKKTTHFFPASAFPVCIPHCLKYSSTVGKLCNNITNNTSPQSQNLIHLTIKTQLTLMQTVCKKNLKSYQFLVACTAAGKLATTIMHHRNWILPTIFGINTYQTALKSTENFRHKTCLCLHAKSTMPIYFIHRVQRTHILELWEFITKWIWAAKTNTHPHEPKKII